MTDEIVGIDLGTTNSELALYRDGRPEILADEQGRKILPSVVGLTEAGDILVGEEARNQLLLYPDRTVRSIKRRMGHAETVRMAGKEYTPQEISAIILKRLKEIAEAQLGHAVRKAVITVPAYFSDTQRQATREAGEIAGLEVMRIINEPTAAALVYEAGQHEGKRILVYDLGGGTFDVSVVRIEEGVVEVISSHGNNHLGGDDFDQKIVAHILEHLKLGQAVDVSDQPRAMARILRAAEAAKRHLSDHPFARIEEEYLTEVEGKPVHLSMELARDEYEAMIAPYVQETLQAIHTALRSAT
jgi:molecular chaperone DnaK (HSP70)